MPGITYEQTQMALKDGNVPQVDAKGQINHLAFKLNVVAKTASYSVLPSESGTLFTTTGATGAVTFTLPAIADSEGCCFWFYNTVDQNMVLTGPADKLVVVGDAAADSAAFQTASEKIGGGFFAVCDGALWLIMPHIWDNGTLVSTITTAT